MSSPASAKDGAVTTPSGPPNGAPKTANKLVRTDTKGKLRKKNSLYLKNPDFDADKSTDLRTLAHQRMEKEKTLKKQQGRNYRPPQTLAKKNSIYMEGTLEHKLSSLMDMAYLDLTKKNPGEENVTEEFLEEQRKRQEKLKDWYFDMKSGDNYDNLQKEMKAKAITDVDKFYENIEKELDQIEKDLGLDKVLPQFGTEEFKQEMKEQKEKEIIKREELEKIAERVEDSMEKSKTLESNISGITSEDPDSDLESDVDGDYGDEIEDDGYGNPYGVRDIIVDENADHLHDDDQDNDQDKGIVEKVIEKVTGAVNSMFTDNDNIKAQNEAMDLDDQASKNFKQKPKISARLKQRDENAGVAKEI